MLSSCTKCSFLRIQEKITYGVCPAQQVLIAVALYCVMLPQSATVQQPCKRVRMEHRSCSTASEQNK